MEAMPSPLPVTLSLLLIAAIAHAVPVTSRLSSTAVVKPGKKRQSLLARSRMEDPGWYRNYGVRDNGVGDEDLGALGDDGSRQDSSLGFNMWTTDGMSNSFPFLDNLEPVAPMDSMHHGDGAFGHDAIYVPPYLNPDGFPTLQGKGCMCQSATAATGRIRCHCGKAVKNPHYTWLKDTPVVGTNNYTLEPADITYSAGNYWRPKPAGGGVISPADKMPRAAYPNQAPGDYVWPVPATADGDRVGLRYARYLDQVQARSEDCDTVSEKCTVSCRPGDWVTVVLGSTRLSAQVTRTFVGNAAEIEFAPTAAASATVTVDCPVEDECSAFRFCRQSVPGQHCVHQKEVQTHNWHGTLVTKFECPANTAVCRLVRQMTMANLLEKQGKACKADFAHAK